MFKFFNKKIKIEDVHVVKPYYMKYDGETGYAQVMEKVTKTHIAIKVNLKGGGTINRVMKITKRDYFSDFGSCCSSLHFKRTDLVWN